LDDPDCENGIRHYRQQIRAYYFEYADDDNRYDEDEYVYAQYGGVLGTLNFFTMSEGIPLEYRLEKDDNVVAKERKFQVTGFYIENTHTENHYFFKIKINDVYIIKRHGEENGYKENLLPKKLLWHGTKTENIASILSRGPEVASPSSESTSAHFGHAIYFTNSSSKAASYCDARRKQRTCEGILLLCEVALGHMAQCYTAQDICLLLA
ncbi:hypothetical protein KQX54_006916, partial [Cotesia glomerata]